MAASGALGGAAGLIVVGSVARRIGVGAVVGDANPDGCLNVEPVFVAAFRLSWK
jgi:hypothetical protein